MNLTLITKKVQESRFLTEAERSYWLEHLPTMNEAQIQELDDILTQAEQVSDEIKPEEYLTIIAKATAALS